MCAVSSLEYSKDSGSGGFDISSSIQPFDVFTTESFPIRQRRSAARNLGTIGEITVELRRGRRSWFSHVRIRLLLCSGLSELSVPKVHAVKHHVWSVMSRRPRSDARRIDRQTQLPDTEHTSVYESNIL